jgi:hypothetical protein
LPTYGDRVHFKTGGTPAAPSFPLVQNGVFKTDEMHVSFLAVDATGLHETGEPQSWQNTVTLKYERIYRDGAVRIALKALPRGTIRYSLDGSNPRYGGIYDGEIQVPDGVGPLLPWRRPRASGRNSCGSRSPGPRRATRSSPSIRTGRRTGATG